MLLFQPKQPAKDWFRLVHPSSHHRLVRKQPVGLIFQTTFTSNISIHIKHFQNIHSFSAYITYSPQTATTIGNQNIQLVKSANGNYLITTPSQQQQTVTASRNSRVSQASPLVFKETDNMSISEIQRQEAVLRLREAKMRCEVQELAKEKAREELMQLREIHRMKIKEMEMRLRNMERS